MTAPNPDPRETLARIRKQADAATEGPWESDGLEGTVTSKTDGLVTDPQGPYLVVDGITRWAESDAEFIAAARTTVPALLDLVDDLLERHVEGQTFYGHGFSQRICECGASWPCPDYTAATTALEGLHHD